MGYFLAIALAGLVAGELLARVWRERQRNPFMSAPIYRSSDALPWELLPLSTWVWNTNLPPDLEPDFHRTIEVNALGYREREFSVVKPSDTFRVLFLGDSYVLGWGVRMGDTVGRYLEALLQSRFPDKRVEVINAAFACGYSPDTYHVYLKHRGLALSPDLVLSSFVPRNDLKEIRANVRIPGPDGHPDRVASKIDFVNDRTHLRQRIFPSRVPRRMKKLSALFEWGIKSVARPLIEGAGDQDALRFLRDPVSAELQESWDVALRCLAGTHAFLQSQAEPIPYLVVLVPEAHEVHPELWRPLGLRFDRALYDEARPQREAVRRTVLAGIPYVDLLPGFRHAARHQRFYFSAYGHWNPAGHRRAAELIADRLVSFLPDCSSEAREASIL